MQRACVMLESMTINVELPAAEAEVPGVPWGAVDGIRRLPPGPTRSWRGGSGGSIRYKWAKRCVRKSVPASGWPWYSCQHRSAGLPPPQGQRRLNPSRLKNRRYSSGSPNRCITRADSWISFCQPEGTLPGPAMQAGTGNLSRAVRPRPARLAHRHSRYWIQDRFVGRGNWLDADNVAILDIHILRAGVLAGFLDAELTVERDYLALEAQFLKFSHGLGVRASELDAVIWLDMILAADGRRNPQRTAREQVQGQARTLTGARPAPRHRHPPSWHCSVNCPTQGSPSNPEQTVAQA